MTQTLQINIRSSWFDRVRSLHINTDFIEFDDKDLIASPPTKIMADDIESFRFGTKWISGYQFIIGRVYSIDVRSIKGDIIKIRLKSLYGINKTELWDKFNNILNALHDNYFDKMSLSYIDLFYSHQSFVILNVHFDQHGIKFLDKNKEIPWDDVGTISYVNYYSIFSKTNSKVYKAFEYLTDWNVAILYSVSRQILKDKGFYKE